MERAASGREGWHSEQSSEKLVRETGCVPDVDFHSQAHATATEGKAKGGGGGGNGTEREGGAENGRVSE